MQRLRITRSASARALTLALCVILAAALASGCTSKRTKVSAAELAAEKSAGSANAGNDLIIQGVNSAGNNAGRPAWNSTLVASTTAAPAAAAAPAAPATQAVLPGTTFFYTSPTFAAPTLLSDGTINDGEDPFIGMLRVPAVPPTWVLPQPSIPTAVAPDGATLDSWAVKSAQLGVVKIAVVNCGGIVEGSGWIAASDTVVTNAHVVAGAERRPRVQVDGTGFRYPASVVYLDVPNDIAILRVPGMNSAKVLSMAANPQPGDPAAIIGFPNGGDVHFDAAQLGLTQVDTTGQFDGWRHNVASRTNMYVSGFGEPGNSGGPVVNVKGEVIATVWGEVFEARPPMTVAVPNAMVSAALSAAGTTEISAGPCIAK